jgi:hypothetical protein
MQQQQQQQQVQEEERAAKVATASASRAEAVVSRQFINHNIYMFKLAVSHLTARLASSAWCFLLFRLSSTSASCTRKRLQ